MACYVTLYSGSTPSPNCRFREQAGITEWLTAATSTTSYNLNESDVNSVPLYVAQRYVDIPWTATDGTAISLARYMRIYNSEESSTVFCFIERAEKNAIDNTVRIYFYPDWWDTFLFNGTAIPKIVGDVERAHVNDIVDGVPTLQYTTEEMEVSPSVSDYVSGAIYAPYGSYEEPQTSQSVYFLHVLVNTALQRDGAFIVTPSGYSHDFIGELIFPVFKASSQIPITNLDGTVVFEDLPLVSTFPTDYILGMYATSYMPYCESTSVEINFTSTTYYRTFTPPSEVVEAMNLSSNDKLLAVIRKPMDYLTLSSMKDTLSGCVFEGQTLSNVTSYTDYLNNLIVKFRSHVYNQAWVDCEGEQVQLKYTSATNSTDYAFRVSAICSDGSYQLENDLALAEYPANLSWHATSAICPPIVVDNYYDRYTARLAATSNQYAISEAQTAQGMSIAKGITGIIGSGVGSAISGATGNVAGALSSAMGGGLAVGSAIQSYEIAAHNESISSMEYVKNMAYAGGIGSTANVNTSFSTGMNNANRPILRYCICGDEEVRLNLALYGYNTHLQPYEILNNHKRRAFNFIKTRWCAIVPANGGFNAEVEADICNMFNKGVFLFSKYDTSFKLETINIPNSF